MTDRLHDADGRVVADGSPAADTGPRYQPPPPGSDEAEVRRWFDDLPFSRHLGLTCASLDQREGLFHLTDGGAPPNPNGAVHGGIVAAAADHCLGAQSVMNAPREQMSVTASLHGQFPRPALPPLTMRTSLTSAGRRVNFVAVEVTDVRGRVCTTFQATMVIGGTERRSPPEAPPTP